MLSIIVAAAILEMSQGGAEAYRACAEIDKNRKRLACFDAASAKDPVLIAGAEAAAEEARAAAAQAAKEAEILASASAEEAAASALLTAQTRAAEAEARAAAAEARLAAAEAENADMRSRVKIERPKTFSAKIKGVVFQPRGNVVVLLDNGEVWEQLTSDSNKVAQRYEDRMQTANFRKGAMGNWFMTAEPVGERLRVRPRDN